MIRYLSERLPVMICPRWVSTRIQPIAIRNVLEYLVALQQPRLEVLQRPDRGLPWNYGANLASS